MEILPMWSYYDNGWPSDLEVLVEPTYAGRRLDAGGFVLGDSFDTLLRSLSEGYLKQAWLRAQSIMEQYQLRATDLSWGEIHPGEANLPNILLDRPIHAPNHWIGWTSKELHSLYLDSRWQAIDEDLKNGSPALRCGTSWRSVKVRVAPDDFTTGLRLIEVFCTSETSDWAPSVVLDGWITDEQPKVKRDMNEPWVKVALAIVHDDQQELDSALSAARGAYTHIGYRIVLRGFATHLKHDPRPTVHLPLDVLENQEP
jgi:hypothetical protein